MSPSDETDAALMRRLQRDDTRAYDALYARWGAKVFQFLVRRTGSRLAAEDALQETWLRVYRYRGRYDPSRRFSAWLYTIAAHAGHDAREPELESFDWEPPTEAQSGLRNDVIRALHALDPDDRKLILLSIEGYTSVELGEMLELKPGTVRMRLKRARDTMKARLSEST